MEISELLSMVIEKKASDLHLLAGSPPVIRLNGRLVYTHLVELSADDVAKLVLALMNDEQKEILKKEREIDFSYQFKALPPDPSSKGFSKVYPLDKENGRFRINAYYQRNTIAAELRLIPHEELDFSKLGLPEIIKDLTRRPRGLILVTGPTGSGKTTTLSAMINLVNEERDCHIVTVEDPIEYTHLNKKSIVSQREIGNDTHSFQRALRVALRQDPDVILVGEMRDLETIQVAITAAETGHLVFATLHTTDAPQTVDRIIDVFPPHQQPQIRTQLAITLVAVISQHLLLRADGSGRIPAVEIMITIPSIRNLIREGKTFQLYSNIETGKEHGMQTLDQALEDLFVRGLISEEEAIVASREPETLQKKLFMHKKAGRAR